VQTTPACWLAVATSTVTFGDRSGIPSSLQLSEETHLVYAVLWETIAARDE